MSLQKRIVLIDHIKVVETQKVSECVFFLFSFFFLENKFEWTKMKKISNFPHKNRKKERTYVIFQNCAKHEKNKK